MANIIFCKYLQREAMGLDFQTYPGELGKQIFNTISQEAWQLWIKQQTILINENKLNLCEIKDRSYLESEMKKFLFKTT